MRDLDGAAATLAELGFSVERMAVAAEFAANRRFYLNSVQIPRPGKPTLLIVPSFAQAAAFGAEEDRRARAFFEALGYEVAFVRDSAHIGAGNNHCLVRRG